MGIWSAGGFCSGRRTGGEDETIAGAAACAGGTVTAEGSCTEADADGKEPADDRDDDGVAPDNREGMTGFSRTGFC